MSARTAYRSTSRQGLDYDSPPMRLWAKAKQLGIWNPADIDLSQDAVDWRQMTPTEQDLILRTTSLFIAGEEAVTVDLLPLIQIVAEEGRLEEEIYLTSFLWEEAKHVDAFHTFLDKVVGERPDLDRYHTPAYRLIFNDKLPSALGALRTDRSPEAQARASATYNLLVEGVLAETGYFSYHKMLVENGLMPGMQQIVAHLKRDESRHLAYGVFLLSRLVAEHGESVWNVIQSQMQELLGPAVAAVDESYLDYDVVPFGIVPNEMAAFAETQFLHRMARIQKAREQSLTEVYGTSDFELVPA
jgi:ribonucleoside-diphosphate reductase beta chain